MNALHVPINRPIRVRAFSSSEKMKKVGEKKRTAAARPPGRVFPPIIDFLKVENALVRISRFDLV